MSEQRAALLIGATGLVGGILLRRLLSQPAYATVVSISRRSLGIEDDKLTEHVADFERLQETSGDWRVDDVFLCLGTTMSAAGSRESFRRVDHDYTVEAARLARLRGATHAGLVSSVGASIGASSFYLRVKGETERDVADLGFRSVQVVQPSFLVGQRSEHRRGESFAVAATTALAWAMVGGLRRYRSIAAADVAAALEQAVLHAAPGVHILTYDDIVKLGGDHVSPSR